MKRRPEGEKRSIPCNRRCPVTKRFPHGADNKRCTRVFVCPAVDSTARSDAGATTSPAAVTGRECLAGAKIGVGPAEQRADHRLVTGRLREYGGDTMEPRQGNEGRGKFQMSCLRPTTQGEQLPSEVT